jgi:geranylgeranyl pyrophosphate synthase
VLGPGWTMVDIRTRDVFAAMQPDLLLVQSRLEEAVRIDFPGLTELILDLVRAGGKRLRPLVLLLAGRAYANDRDTLVTAGAGVELLHTASLVHDDTVDRAGTRRGRPTLNSVLPSGAVILLGDFLFAQSAMLAAATNSPRVVSIFASTLSDICDGQLREMFFAHRLDQSREEYERRIFGKTASLFAGSAEMGAVIGNAPESAVQALRRYGSDVGMAFQIVDDVLDLREGASQLGKPAGHDLTQGTVTLPTIIYASSLTAASDAAARLQSVVSGEISEPSEVNRVVEEIRVSGALEAAMDGALEFGTRSKTHVEATPDPEIREMLEQIADVVCERSA